MYPEWFYWNPWVAICLRVEMVPGLTGSSLQLFLHEQVKNPKELTPVFQAVLKGTASYFFSHLL